MPTPKFEANSVQTAFITVNNRNPVPLDISSVEMVVGTNPDTQAKGVSEPLTIAPDGQSPELQVDVPMPNLNGDQPVSLFVNTPRGRTEFSVVGGVNLFNAAVPEFALDYNTEPQEVSTPLAVSSEMNNPNPLDEEVFGIELSVGPATKDLGDLVFPGNVTDQPFGFGDIILPDTENLGGWPVKLKYTWRGSIIEREYIPKPTYVYETAEAVATFVQEVIPPPVVHLTPALYYPGQAVVLNDGQMNVAAFINAIARGDTDMGTVQTVSDDGVTYPTSEMVAPRAWQYSQLSSGDYIVVVTGAQWIDNQALIYNGPRFTGWMYGIDRSAAFPNAISKQSRINAFRISPV